MTTKLELAEIIIEAEKTGRQIQERGAPGASKWKSYDGGIFHLDGYEYRLAPKKIVKHGGWFSKAFLELNAKHFALIVPDDDDDDIFVQWETEE